MPATHSAEQRRRRSRRAACSDRAPVVRGGGPGASWLAHRLRDDRRGRRLRRHDAFDHDRLVARRRDEVQLAGRERLDPLGRLAAFRSRAAAGARSLPRRRAAAASPRPGSRGAAARSAARPRTAAPARGSAATPTDFHSSRCRASSTSRTIGLLRTSFLIAYSNASAMVYASLSAARSFALRARGLRCTSSSSGDERLLRQHLHARPSRCCERAQRVLDDAVLERVKRDHDQPRAGAQPARRRPRESDRARRARG